MTETKQLFRVILVICSVFGISLSAPPPCSGRTSRSFTNALNQQGIQTILQSIEDRLRNLDQIYSIRYSQRPDFNSDQYVRKIEMLETKLARMESLLEVQLEKLSENMSSKNFKDDIAKDQVFRKIDSVYERINHKLGYIEGKFDMDVLKLQRKIETALTKMDRLDHSMSVRQADMESEISEGIEVIENVKNSVLSMEQKVMNATKQSISSFHNTYANFNLDNINTAITQIEKKLLNNSLERCQQDFPNDFTNKDVPTKAHYGNKINNMYDELWKKSTALEDTVQHSIQLMNITRKEIQDNMNNLLRKTGNKLTNYDNQNDGAIGSMVDSLGNTLNRKLAELGRKMESNFENIMLAQNLFLESCHRIQMDETQLETKISLVLEKLLESFTNRNATTNKQLQNMEEIIKSHDANIHRAVNQNTNTIIKLSEKTSDDRKKIEKNLSTIKKEIGNAVVIIRNEINDEDTGSDKLDTIENILLDLQTQVNDLDGKMNKDNVNYNAKQTLQDVLLQTKDLFTKQLNSSAISVETIAKVEDFLKNINRLLNSIGSKLDKCNVKPHSQKFNFSELNSDDKQKISGFHDNIDIVLDILDKNNDDDTNTNNLFLSRFNYSILEETTVHSPINYQEQNNDNEEDDLMHSAESDEAREDLAEPFLSEEEIHDAIVNKFSAASMELNLTQNKSNNLISLQSPFPDNQIEEFVTENDIVATEEPHYETTVASYDPLDTKPEMDALTNAQNISETSLTASTVAHIAISDSQSSSVESSLRCNKILSKIDDLIKIFTDGHKEDGSSNSDIKTRANNDSSIIINSATTSTTENTETIEYDDEFDE